MTKSENGFAWTDDLAQEAKRRFLGGESASQVAAAIGKPGYRPTRNAIIGKLDRMGVKLLSTSRGELRGLNRPLPKPKLPINFQSEGGAQLTPHVAPTPVRYRCEPLPNSRCVGLLDVEPHHCRWMVERDGADFYCGADKASGSLCETHHGYAYYPAKVSGREFARSLRRFA